MNKKNYTTSFDIIKLGDSYIELLESFPCNSNLELHKREGTLIRENKVHCVNKLIAGRTGKEYYNDNKETYIKYREDNKDKIKEFCCHYRKENKHKLHQYLKEYNAVNKEQISKHKSSVIQCECENTYTRCHKQRHMESKKHLESMNKLINQ